MLCQRPFDLSDLSVECLRFVLFDLDLCLPQTEVLVCKGEQAILRREKGADLVPKTARSSALLGARRRPILGVPM